MRLKIIIALVLSLALASCSAQKRAERHIRKAVALCPALVQMKAHTIDTVLTVPSYADVATVPLQAVLSLETVYAATPHGTVVVSMRPSDSSLRVGFVAAPQKIHFRDTLHYQQVAITPSAKHEESGGFWPGLFSWISGVGLGAALCFYFIKRKKQINTNTP